MPGVNTPRSSAAESFIRKMLAGTSAPVGALVRVLDDLFSGEPWWDYEPETIRQETSRAGFPVSDAVLSEIMAIGAFRKGVSFIDKEWHLFEKFVLTVCRIPVLFFDKQNVPIEHIWHAVRLVRPLGPFEPSDEVKHYIGCEGINDDILWHPDPFIDECIRFALQNIYQTLGLTIDQLNQMRDAVKGRFNEVASADLETVEWDGASVADVMCSRIIRSLSIGKLLSDNELRALETYDAVQQGKAHVEGVVSKTDPDSQTPPEHDESKDDGELVTAIPDTSEYLYAVKEGAAPFEIFSMSGISIIEVNEKMATLTNLPIVTGVSKPELEQSSDDFELEVETTAPKKGPAKDVMMQQIEDELSGSADEPNQAVLHDDQDTSSDFGEFSL